MNQQRKTFQTTVENSEMHAECYWSDDCSAVHHMEQKQLQKRPYLNHAEL